MRKEKRLNLVKAVYWLFMLDMIVIGLAMIIEEGFVLDLWILGVGTILLGSFIWAYLGYWKEYKDERLAKAAGSGMTVSWFSTVLALVLLTLLSKIVSPITTVQLAGALLVVMAVSFSASNEWLKHKGEVEDLAA